MKYTIRKNMRFGTTIIKCQDNETANVFLAAPAMVDALEKIRKITANTIVYELANEALALVEGK